MSTPRRRVRLATAARRPTPPLPGRRVRGSTSGRPIMALLDLIGRRWVLRILWELRDGALKFRELQERCGGLSPTIVNRRVDELKRAGLIAYGEQGGYALTAHGEELLAALAPLNAWANSWAAALRRKKP